MQVFNILSLINVEASVTCVTAEASGQLWEERERRIWWGGGVRNGSRGLFLI